MAFSPRRRCARRSGLCPHAVFLESRHHLYSEWSDRVAAILGKYSPVVEMASVDEAYLDLAGTERLYGPPLAAAHALLREITKTTGLPCSAGLARTRLVAKVASDQAKPRGLLWVPAGERGNISCAAGHSANSWDRKSHRGGAAGGGNRDRRPTRRCDTGKTRAGFRPLGYGAPPQGARRRHIRIFRGRRAEIDLAQSHLFIRHRSTAPRSMRRSACLPESDEASARREPQHFDGDANDSLRRVRNLHPRAHSPRAHAPGPCRARNA